MLNIFKQTLQKLWNARTIRTLIQANLLTSVLAWP